MGFMATLRALAMGAILVSGAGHALAQQGPNLNIAPTPLEKQALPPGCQAKLDGTPAVQKAFLHLHHYCFGLNSMNRARTAFDRRHRGFYLKTAIGEFDYVLDRLQPTDPLKPEVERAKFEAVQMQRLLQMP
jgi:hypothetical protein